jgi:hypothetical protein
MNPFTREVSQNDIENLKLNQLDFNKRGFAILGAFSSMWHDAQVEEK